VGLMQTCTKRGGGDGIIPLLRVQKKVTGQ